MAKKLKFDDLVGILHSDDCEDGAVRDVFSSRSGSASLSMEQACAIFPDLENYSGDSVVYVPVNMAHSLPSRNLKGRGFSDAVLRRSAAGLQDSLVNDEHRMGSQFLGHVKAAVFDPSGLREVASSLFDDDCKGKPLVALTALYLRNPKVSEVINEHTSGDSWFVSMECVHNLRDDAAFYDGEFIPLTEAPRNMLACIGSGSVASYRGKELTLALGGEDGNVRFDAIAFTKSPADKNGDVLGFYTPRSASKRFFPGLDMVTTASREAASFSLKLAGKHREKSAISVIGQTEPASDGHVHDITSSLNILIANGHSHYFAVQSLDLGSKPVFTGLTGEHYLYDDMGNQASVHSHLVSIPLRPSKVRDAASTVDEGDFRMKLFAQIRELGSRLDKALEKGKSKTGDDDDKNGDVIKIARELASVDLDKALKEALDERLTSGDFVKKEDSEKAVKEASDAAVLSYQKHVEVITAREKKVSDLGIKLDHVISGEGDDAVTVRSLIGNFPTDTDGGKSFDSQLALMTALVPNVDDDEARKKLDEEAAAKDSEESREAASILTKIVAAGTTGTKISSGAARKVGRHLFS